MAKYIVTYDLHKAGQNYSCIKEKLKGYGKWCHLQGSVWIISTSQNASQIRDHLRSCLDSNDKLMVAKLEGEAAWLGYSNEVTNWIKEVA